MAENQKTSFPLMPVGHWWTLRTKFKQSIPGIVTDNYLSSVLNMTVASARANILPPLRAIGIIDDNGKTTDLAKKWRDDEQYNNVCEQIKKAAYPEELISTFSGPDLDRVGCSRWFANHTGAGEVAVRKMVAFYAVLNDGNPENGKSTSNPTPSKKIKPESNLKKVTKPKVESAQLPVKEPVEDETVHSNHRSARPQNQAAIHLNLQIHISADASSDQIDKIFESMAKHIYKDHIVNA